MLNKIELFELLAEIALKNESVDSLIETINNRSESEQKEYLLNALQLFKEIQVLNNENKLLKVENRLFEHNSTRDRQMRRIKIKLSQKLLEFKVMTEN